MGNVPDSRPRSCKWGWFSIPIILTEGALTPFHVNTTIWDYIWNTFGDMIVCHLYYTTYKIWNFVPSFSKVDRNGLKNWSSRSGGRFGILLDDGVSHALPLLNPDTPQTTKTTREIPPNTYPILWFAIVLTIVCRKLANSFVNFEKEIGMVWKNYWSFGGGGKTNEPNG